MNMELRQPLRAQKTRYGIVDCDIHPKLLLDDMRPFLSNQWWSHPQTYGLRPRHGFAKTYRCLRSPRRRRGATPGRRPAACRARDLAFLQQPPTSMI